MTEKVKQEFIRKIAELGESATLLGEQPSAAILFALAGSLEAGFDSDKLLCNHMADFVRDVLIPRQEALRAQLN